MPEAKNPFRVQTFFYEALEPVHIGAGGYRLGRVDNTICREPGTNLPKIPGTSLAGAARAYASLRYGKPEASGQHKKLKGANAAECPILYTFGTATDEGGGSAGRVSFGDAQIVLFPVATMKGPVWVSTPDLIRRWAKEEIETSIEDQTKILVGGGVIAPSNQAKLNLGWILFHGLGAHNCSLAKMPNSLQRCASKLVLVHEGLFPQIVNSNLEVRTSVSISADTGAAESGALFTYEAIPRGTILAHEVVEDRHGEAPFPGSNGVISKQFKEGRENSGDNLSGGTWSSPLEVAKAGLSLIGTLGIGGMGTRGFGRIAIEEGGLLA